MDFKHLYLFYLVSCAIWQDMQFGTFPVILSIFIVNTLKKL